MNILLLGKNGQVGWELQRSLAVLGDVTALDRNGANGLCGDLDDLDGLRATLDRLKPDVVVNAAAYTAVDQAESEPELAYRINAEAPQVLAEALAKSGGWLVHYSTDYVFDGSGQQPWQEGDAADPLNMYGKTKLGGEQAIQSSGCKYLIFRTSWVYGARGGNFAKTMLRLAAEREQLQIINDQFGAPTGADLIADISAHAIKAVYKVPGLSGLYHLVAAGTVSWYGYASLVIQRAREIGNKLAVQHLEPISTADYPTAAVRPLNSRMGCHKLCEAFELELPIWQDGVTRMLIETQGP